MKYHPQDRLYFLFTYEMIPYTFTRHITLRVSTRIHNFLRARMLQNKYHVLYVNCFSLRIIGDHILVHLMRASDTGKNLDT